MVNNLNPWLFDPQAIALDHSGQHPYLRIIKDLSLLGCGGCGHRVMFKSQELEHEGLEETQLRLCFRM